MGLILTIIIGGVAGWLASKIMRTDHKQGVLLNIAAGTLGALLMNWIVAPLIGYSAILDRLDLGGFLLALIGACIVIGLVKLFTGPRRRI